MDPSIAPIHADCRTDIQRASLMISLAGGLFAKKTGSSALSGRACRSVASSVDRERAVLLPKPACRQRLCWLIAAIALSVLGLTSSVVAEDAVAVQFDIPDRLECRDVTPEKCAKAHPDHRVIEAKFKISAHFTEGGEAQIAHFDYLIVGAGGRLRMLDYLPNTTLESAYDDDRIEVADYTESNDSVTGDARVGYSIFSLTGTLNQSTKKTEENRYKRIAPKSLVLASGTTNRGHGVFYKLRPSSGASLEGAREFTFLAVVPKVWRGDWCEFTCLARAAKKPLVGSPVVGVEHAHVGLYMQGDQEASRWADELCNAQQAEGGLLAKRFAKEVSRHGDANHSTLQGPAMTGSDEVRKGLLLLRLEPPTASRKLEQVRRSLLSAESQLERLATKRTEPLP